MKIAKTVGLWILLILVVGMIGCSSGSSSGGSTTPTTPTSPLVGTWNNADYGITLTFRADGTGNDNSGHAITDWTLSASNVLNLKLNGTPEVFQLTWLNTANTSMSLQNIGPNSSETLNYTKA